MCCIILVRAICETPFHKDTGQIVNYVLVSNVLGNGCDIGLTSNIKPDKELSYATLFSKYQVTSAKMT